MDRKIKIGIGPAEICSIIFGVIGTIYLVIGLMLQNTPPNTEEHDASIAFTILGGVFLLTTVILLVTGTIKRRRLQRIVNEGRYVWGEIADITVNYNVRVNSRNPYIVMVRHVDRNGSIHMFRSNNQYKYPDRSIIGKQVKVFYEDESFKHYYVDLDGVLPKITMH